MMGYVFAAIGGFLAACGLGYALYLYECYRAWTES